MFFIPAGVILQMKGAFLIGEDYVMSSQYLLLHASHSQQTLLLKATPRSPSTSNALI